MLMENFVFILDTQTSSCFLGKTPCLFNLGFWDWWYEATRYGCGVLIILSVSPGFIVTYLEVAVMNQSAR